jgi:cation:H+ antiporter
MLLASASNLLLMILFLAASAIIWIAGKKITYATDDIAASLKLGEAFGGLVLLAIVTNLPEIAITTVAAWNNDLDIAISNILGGIAIQTVVLVLIDIFGVGKTSTLTFKSSSYLLLLEGIALIFILTLVLIGKQFSPDFIFFRTTPFEWLIVLVWLGSIYLVSRQSTHPNPHPRKGVYQHSGSRVKKGDENHVSHFPSLQKALLVFFVCAIATLFAGWALEETGSLLADRFHMSGVLFGATILALSTSLPEISTGIASAKIKDYQMAVSDIFGGNAFLPVLFIVASLISGNAILPDLKASDSYLTGIGILLTGIYMIGIILPNKKQIGRMGIDSLLVLLVYLASLAGLVILS